jgi:hypothetical protein
MATFFPASVSMLTLLPTGSSSGHRPMTPMARERAREKVYAEASGDIANAGGIEKKKWESEKSTEVLAFPSLEEEGLSLSLSLHNRTSLPFFARFLFVFSIYKCARKKKEMDREKRKRESGEKRAEHRKGLRPFLASFRSLPTTSRHFLLHLPLPLLLLRGQRHTQDARQLRQDGRARDRLAGLVLLHDLRLLVDGLRERSLRHALGQPGGHDALLELRGDAVALFCCCFASVVHVGFDVALRERRENEKECERSRVRKRKISKTKTHRS